MALYLPQKIVNAQDLRALVEAALIHSDGSFRPEALLYGLRRTLTAFRRFRGTLYRRQGNPSSLEDVFSLVRSLGVLEPTEGEQYTITPSGRDLLENRFTSQYGTAIFRELDCFTKAVWENAQAYHH